MQSGWTFSTYAYTCIYHEICYELRKINKRAKTISLEEEIKSGEGLLLGTMLKDEQDIENDFLDNEDKKALYKYIIQENILKPKELECIKLYLQGIKQSQIGEKMNTSQTYVSRIIKRATEKIKKELGGKESDYI